MEKLTDEELLKEYYRLDALFKRVSEARGREYQFDEIYKKLQAEYELSGGQFAEYVMGSYNHNLRQTIDKQASTYSRMKLRRPKQGAPTEYNEFISNFLSDISNPLTRRSFEAKQRGLLTEDN